MSFKYALGRFVFEFIEIETDDDVIVKIRVTDLEVSAFSEYLLLINKPYPCSESTPIIWEKLMTPRRHVEAPPSEHIMRPRTKTDECSEAGTLK